MEVDFLKGALQKSRGSTPAQQRLWRAGIYEHIPEVMPLQGRMQYNTKRAALGARLQAASPRGANPSSQHMAVIQKLTHFPCNNCPARSVDLKWYSAGYESHAVAE